MFFVWHFQYQNDIWTVSSARGYISMVLCRARKILKVLKYFLLWYTATLETIAAAGTKAIVTNLRIIAQKYIWYCLENVWQMITYLEPGIKRWFLQWHSYITIEHSTAHCGCHMAQCIQSTSAPDHLYTVLVPCHRHYMQFVL